MIELGKYQDLTVVREASVGIYLGENAGAGPEERVLLPKKQVPENIKVGDSLRVFVYKDSEDRRIATVRPVKISLHETALLEVKQINRVGAFLDMGLERDLLLPYHEQTRKLIEGQEVLCAMYVDKSGRLAATMKVYPYLSTSSPYNMGDTVVGEIYQYAHNFGYFVAVDQKYSGLIPKKEAQGELKVGQILSLRVSQVHEDGKLDLSPHQKAYLQMGPDADRILKKITEDFGGDLPFDDKADPEKIAEVFGLSKAAFKRAVGRLYKERKISIEGGRIRVL